MPFDWTKYLDIAKYLNSNTEVDREAAQRTTVSRAYYAAYCYARNHAVSFLGFIPQNDPQDHENVRKHYQHSGLAGVADKLDSLRRIRNVCDYDDEILHLENLPAYAIREADAIYKRLKK
jgi:hypothetical protein